MDVKNIDMEIPWRELHNKMDLNIRLSYHYLANEILFSIA